MSVLDDLVRAAGIQRHWQDVTGRWNSVAEDDVRALLGTLGLDAADDAQIRRSLGRIAHSQASAPKLVTADAGEPFVVPAMLRGRYRLLDADGVAFGSGELQTGETIAAPASAGYYMLQTDDAECILAVAPPPPRARRWTYGVAAQLYGLRRCGDGGIGDFNALGRIASALGARGADALALSPVHAMFAHAPAHASPYSPSSRVLLNILHVDPAQHYGQEVLARILHSLGLADRWQQLERAPLIDWADAGRVRIDVLRALHRHARQRDDAQWNVFKQWRCQASPALEAHARFETIHARGGLGHDWRRWPSPWHDADGAAVRSFAAANGEEVEFHCFAQWLAADGLRGAQTASLDAGMRIGLIADLAIGCDPSGSDAWRQPGVMPPQLSIGAPPDLLAPQGQGWGLTTYSPMGLRETGFAPYLELLRATLAGTGAVRIDHVIGMERLWLMPQGADPGHGAYVDYPRDDLMRLLALEAHLHGALVVGEDLGTVPYGFRERLAARRMLGMSVLMFERDGDGFLPVRNWRDDALAMTSTHDLPTLAGWWEGRDLDWRRELGLLDDDALALQRQQRREDRRRLAARIDADGGSAPRADDDTAASAFVDAAIAHVARAPAPLVVVPLEDLLGDVEQPNLPGTVDGHPNWRRRMPEDVDILLAHPAVRVRLDALDALRQVEGSS